MFQMSKEQIELFIAELDAALRAHLRYKSLTNTHKHYLYEIPNHGSDYFHSIMDSIINMDSYKKCVLSDFLEKNHTLLFELNNELAEHLILSHYQMHEFVRLYYAYPNNNVPENFEKMLDKQKDVENSLVVFRELAVLKLYASRVLIGSKTRL